LKVDRCAPSWSRWQKELNPDYDEVGVYRRIIYRFRKMQYECSEAEPTLRFFVIYRFWKKRGKSL